MLEYLLGRQAHPSLRRDAHDQLQPIINSSTAISWTFQVHHRPTQNPFSVSTSSMTSRYERSLLLFLLIFLVTPSSTLAPSNAQHDYAEIGSPVFWWKMFISVCLILLGGIFAGLTLGLMGLDELYLRVLAMSSDNEKDKHNATQGASYTLLLLFQI